jgi:hypothetical protein
MHLDYNKNSEHFIINAIDIIKCRKKCDCIESKTLNNS